MNDRDALLTAIGEHPEEDTPRLMYADWLEENGDPDRADFVRNQVELARSGLTADERYPLVRTNVRADDAVAAEIADGRFPDLAELYLGSNTIGDAGALALANSPYLTKLRLLDLQNNNIPDRAAQNALRKRFGKVLKL